MIQSRISNAKNHLVLPDAYASNAELYQNDVNAKVPATRDIYRRYWERCRQSDAMDFDDLLVYTYLLFRDHPEIRQKVCRTIPICIGRRVSGYEFCTA